jgi:hypothetical protein
MTDEQEDFSGEEIDIEPFEGQPDFASPQTNHFGSQDEDALNPDIVDEEDTDA